MKRQTEEKRIPETQKSKWGGGNEPLTEFIEKELDGLIVLHYIGIRLAKEYERNLETAVPKDSRTREWNVIQEGRIHYEHEVQKKRRRLRIKRILRYIAVFFITFILVNLILVETVEAYREAVIRMITRDGKHAVDIYFENDGDAEPIDPSILVYAPAYLPEGFKTEQIESWEFGTTVYYKKGKQIIRFAQKSQNAGFSIDNEHGETGSIRIQGYEGIYIELNDEIILMWSNGEAVFQLKGQLSLKEILKIAESVVKIAN